MKVYFEKKVLWGFFVALSILAVLGIYSYKNSQDAMTTSQRVSHTNEVLYHIERLHSNHLEIEAELMRYTINADPAFEHFFQTAVISAREHFTTLLNLTKDNLRQQANLDSIQLLGSKKVELIYNVVGARKHSMDSVRKLIPSPYNKKLLKGIEKGIEAMQQEEKRLLDHRMEANQQESEKFNTTFIILLIVTGVLIIVLFLTINATLRAQLQAEEGLKVASEEIRDLYNNAPCGYHSIDPNGIIVEMNKTWLEWIGYEREEVIHKLKFSELLTPKSQEFYQNNFSLLKSQGFVRNLEFEVVRKNSDILLIILNSTAINDDNGNFTKSRSTVFDITARQKAEQKVIETNKELEAFTYSVSHDLRAPLRSIDGYSKILQEDYGFHMDAEANRLIEIIRRNARRMGQLIDDLLNFSRLGRKDLTLSPVHMNSLIDHIRYELMVTEQEREIQFTVHPLDTVEADANMIRQVWINLISNALKYSRLQRIAKIEIGSNKMDTHIVYYIRDNGVGFDMKYVDKLFGVFQRLHKVEEFDGTGVGLALAHRIVNRHGGKIWAEARVNEGATFFFILPTLNLN